MEILEIQMKHFGKFEGQAMSFHPGLNIIYGENETGKSTICVFLRAMLFGLDRGRGRASRNDEYTLRQPWENGGYYAGSMRFRCGGKIFCLERNFSKEERGARLFCETDGEELDVARGDLDNLLDNLSEATVSNTFFLGGLTGKTAGELAEEIHNAMINAKSGAVSDIRVTDALGSLKKEKKETESLRKKLLEEETVRTREILMRQEYARQEIEELLEEEAGCREELEALTENDTDEEQPELRLPFREGAADRGLSVWAIGKIVMTLIAAAAVAGGLMSSDWEKRAICAAVILAACIGVKICAVRESAREELLREQLRLEREEALQQAYQMQKQWARQRRMQAPKKQKLQMNLEWLRSARHEKEALVESLQEEYERICREGKEREAAEEKLSALNLAIDTLTQTAAEIYREHEKLLNERVSQILTEITGGRYSSVYIDEDLHVRVRMGQRMLQMEQLSRGTMEQIWFALRMAAGEFLNQEEPFPILLDDAFQTYDDSRLERTLHWLNHCGRQVILFSCQKREQQICDAQR